MCEIILYNEYLEYCRLESRCKSLKGCTVGLDGIIMERDELELKVKELEGKLEYSKSIDNVEDTLEFSNLLLNSINELIVLQDKISSIKGLLKEEMDLRLDQLNIISKLESVYNEEVDILVDVQAHVDYLSQERYEY